MGAQLICPEVSAAAFLLRAAQRMQLPLEEAVGALRFGIDLGTATIVLCAVDARGEPVYWDCVATGVVRDGVVVDFHGAVRAVAELKQRAQNALGLTVEAAATAHPPGVPLSDCQACRYVLEQAQVECRLLIDEVSAAQELLQVRDGIIVDVGGGSTGVGVFRDGRLAALSDRPGGGHHLDLILAGALRIPVPEAEARKRLGGGEHLNILRPGVERIADSIRRQTGSTEPLTVHLAGGALLLPGADQVVAQYLGWPVVAYPHAHLITPFGIALS
jgi:ethanolamine utilization protein EutJ